MFQRDVFEGREIPQIDLTPFRKAIWEGGQVTGDGSLREVAWYLAKEITL